jgi:hypothetical protein
MHRDDTTKFLLYIEPPASEKLPEPINDELTQVIEYALSKADEGTANYSSKTDDPKFRPGAGYKGSHRTECGERSANKDYLLENGMITNSLAPFYVKYYRYSIPESDMTKLMELSEFYKGKDLTIIPKKKDESEPWSWLNNHRNNPNRRRK